MMSKVLVLLSTYNGEKFLKEQLDSILSQKHVDVYLLIRDDGSRDATRDIIQEYVAQNKYVEWLAGDNVGFVRSFTSLLESAVNFEYQPDFYAFADQDDIWMPDKLYQACLSLKAKDDSKPNLFTSNSLLIDGVGNGIGVFHQVEPHYSKGNILIYCTEQGCSMTFNRKALELFIQKPPKIAFHDRYMYMICSFFGSVSYCHRPLFYYRLHGHNTLGLGEVKETNKGIFSKACHLLKFLVSNQQESNHRIMAQEFYENYGEALSEEDSQIIKGYVDYCKGFLNRLKLLNHVYYHPCYHDFKLKTKINFLLNVLFLKY